VTPLAASEAAGPREGGRGPSFRKPRAPSELPLLEDLVTLRMRRASSGNALAGGGPVAAPPGPRAQHQQPQRPLPPPGATIAGHRAAFSGALAAGSGAGMGMGMAAVPQQQGAEGRSQNGIPGQSSAGETSLHLRRIRDRIAAMTSGSKAAAAEGTVAAWGQRCSDAGQKQAQQPVAAAVAAAVAKQQ
jgi:hypothetical protein